MPITPGSSDHERDRWVQSALEEYKSLRDESLKALQAQQLGLQIGVTLLAALIGIGLKLSDHLTGAVLLDVASPLLVILLTIVWQGELERSVRAGRYLKERERLISEVAGLPDHPPAMFWEGWLSSHARMRLTYYYHAEFAVIGLIALVGSGTGMIGLLTEHRWKLGLVMGCLALALLVSAAMYYRINGHRLLAFGTTARTGLIAFSFGERRPGTGPCPPNVQLAAMVHSLVSSWASPLTIVVQSEIAEHLTDFVPDLVVESQVAGTYVDSVDVWVQAREFFRGKSIGRVIPVAQPVLHSSYVRRLIRHDGFVVVPVHMTPIGFDGTHENVQWWTRGPVRLCSYALIRPLIQRRRRRGSIPQVREKNSTPTR
jgi:hypothetical protein